MEFKNTPGIFNIYKEKGMTSHDVIDELRRITNIKKIGHAGTLDPMATGVLVVGIGRENTKKLSQIVGQEKEYLATIRLGSTSSTDDTEGEIKKNKIDKKPTFSKIEKIIKLFEGKIKQRPPDHSAIKIKGEKAYQIARKGKKPDLKPRIVFVKKISLINYKWPNLELKIMCSKGVYIRSLARDIGKKLNTGGYLVFLQRTRVGDFKIENSIKIKN